MTSRTHNRWNKQLSIAVTATIRQQFAQGHCSPGTGWEPASVLATASGVCRELGLTGGPPTQVMIVVAGVNVYSRMFLPWTWDLLPAGSWDARALTFTRGDEQLIDFLWAEPWDLPLPPSAHFAEAPGRVRVLNLLQPLASRQYVDGRHTPLRVRAVA